MSDPLRILLLSLAPSLHEPVMKSFEGIEPKPDFSSASTRDEFSKLLHNPPDLIIAGHKDFKFGAEQALDILQAQGLVLPLIVLASDPMVESAVDLLRQGAADYLGRNQLARLSPAAIMALSRRESRQRMLAANEKRYRALVENMQEGVITVDTQGLITFSNPSFCELIGCSPQEVVEQPIVEVFGKEVTKVLDREFEKRKAGNASSYEVTITTRDGDEKFVRVSAVPMFDQQGQFSGSSAIITDLTELRRAEDAITNAAHEWRQSFDSIEDMIMVTDLECNIVRCNLALAQHLGEPIRDILGCKCYEKIHKCNQPPNFCRHLKVHETGDPAEFELNIPDSKATLLVSISPLRDTDGKVTGTVQIFRDVTQRRSQEQETLRLAEALVESFQATTQALTSMVESRDPYTSGHSQGVAELADQIGRKMGYSEEDLKGINVCALLHDIGKGAIPLDILNKPGELTEHEKGIINEHPATAYNILKRISFPWPVADVVWQHHERMDGSGYPRGLKADKIHPWARLLAVADTVEAMTSHRPYRPAISSHDTFKFIREGSGVLFDPEVVEATIEALGMDDRRVMVVDDDPGVLGVITGFLKRQAYEVVGFQRPEQAIEAYAENPTPLVLTDLKMPVISGLEVLRRVKSHKPDAEVIVITGHGDKESVVAAMRMGASDFLEKPVQMSELSEAVSRARERYSRAKES